MTHTIFAKQALTHKGWQNDITVEINKDGLISSISGGNGHADTSVDILLPALSNVHSHSFQRAMAGLAETRGPTAHDDFWTWRQVMYRFLDILTPEDVEIIATQVQMEMLEAGFAAQAEFHYLHHAPNGTRYEQLDETSIRHFNAATTTGIGYTHLPVLYTQGGLDRRPLAGGQQRFGNDIDQFSNLLDLCKSKLARLPADFELGVAPHSLRAVSASDLTTSIKMAGNGPVHIHVAEQTGEVAEVQDALGARPVQWLLDNHQLTHNWCLIHATHMDNKEIDTLAETGAIVGLCPLTEANLGDGIFNASRYLQNAGRFGIGSDSNVKIALGEELRMLEVSQRLRDRCRVILTDDDTPSNGRFLYERAAIGGARAIGRSSGQITKDAIADLIALDGNHHSIAGLVGDKILDSWIFSGDDDLISDVWSAGRHVVTNGRHPAHEKIESDFVKTVKRLRQLV